LDEQDRFTYEFSKHKDVLNPSVSKYLINQGFHAEYPDGKKFAVVLTHDIDDVYVKRKHVLLSFRFFPEIKDMHGIMNLLKGNLDKRKSPYMNLKKIVQMEKKYDATSSFYFLANGDDIFGFKYDLDELADEIGYLIDEGCEIGSHTGYYSYNKLDEIEKEKQAIEKITGQKIVGVRNHTLRFRVPESWEILAKAGFKYDTSLNYHDMVGFRNGMCHPFQPFNLNEKKTTNILEIPLIASDIAFRAFMKTDAVDSWKYLKQLIDIAEKLNGVLTILWHNWTFSLPTSYSCMFGKEWTELYEKILNYSYRKNAWITNCRKIWEYYEKTGVLKLD